MIRLCTTISAKYHVGRRIVNTPLNNSIQYFLKDDHGQEISSWTGVDLKMNGDLVTVVNEIPKEISAKMEMIK